MRWMADVRGLGDRRCEPSDGDQSPILGQLVEEWAGGEDLRPGRAAVRGLGSRVRWHDVPAEGIELELREHALNDGGGCLRRPAARQLALGHERQAGDARAPVAWRFAD